MSSTMKFRPVNKDRLYYDCWQYCMSFFVPEASALRDLNHDAIDEIIRARRQWRQITKQRWEKNGTKILTNMMRRQEITDQNVEDLHAVTRVLESATDFKTVVSINTIWVYSNDLNLFQQLQDLPFVIDVVYTEAKIHRPRDTVVLKKTNHTQRTYFCSVKLTWQEKQHLVNFLENSSGAVRSSPSLMNWLAEEGYLRTQDYFFVDHNETSWLTMLNLVRPGLIRKTMQIHKAK
jgi:PII-like signaling protein